MKHLVMTTLAVCVVLLSGCGNNGDGSGSTTVRPAGRTAGNSGLATGYVGVLPVFPAISYIAKRIAMQREFRSFSARSLEVAA